MENQGQLQQRVTELEQNIRELEYAAKFHKRDHESLEAKLQQSRTAELEAYRTRDGERIHSAAQLREKDEVLAEMTIDRDNARAGMNTARTAEYGIRLQLDTKRKAWGEERKEWEEERKEWEEERKEWEEKCKAWEGERVGLKHGLKDLRCHLARARGAQEMSANRESILENALKASQAQERALLEQRGVARSCVLAALNALKAPAPACDSAVERCEEALLALRDIG
ncbi:hypothetical protein OF83DRAFT_1177640 [Amylostereum chailletii]|nr:hypothetical protein OF83DRAFT_1177640 [Amylostereum chailletii]